MNQEQFLKALKRALRALKAPERQRYLDSYRELIADMMENGIPEEEAVRRQGDVQDIAREILNGAAPSGKRMGVLGILLLIVSILLTVFSLMNLLLPLFLGGMGFFQVYPENSIGIIGGADGPTAIFVTTQFDIGNLFLYLLTVVMWIGTIAYFVHRRRKSQK